MDRILKLETNINANNMKEFIVKTPKIYRDNDWSNVIGSLQKELDNFPLEKKITFDFTLCRWIDPLPLLSLLIEIVRIKKREIDVHAIFPNADNGEEYPSEEQIYQKSPNRFLLFMAKEGFLNELFTNGILVKIGKDKLVHVDKDKLLLSQNDKELLFKEIKGTPCYVDSYFIPVKLYEIPRPPNDNETESSIDGFAAKTVENLLESTELSLHAKCSAPERQHLLYNLRAILQEFFHNVQEHAYTSDEKNNRLAAIYVRYRQGGAVLVSDVEKTSFNEGVNQEYSKCKMTSKDWLAARSGCLEVFFLDRGIGLVNHFNTNSDSDKKVLDKVMRQTFFEGKSNKLERKTEHGGLFLLHELMKRSTDYVRALDDKTWFGCAVPIDKQTANLIKDNDVPYGLTGLAYHLRLGWKASTEDDQTWLKFNTEEVNHIWGELSRTPESCQDLFSWFNDCSIWDERFENMVPPKNIKSKFVLWLPKPNQMKWDVLNRLEVLSKQVIGTCFLIIADISSIEAAVYKAAMSNCSFHPNEDWPKTFQTIALCTNRWSFAFAENEIKENKRHGFSTFSKIYIEDKFKGKVKINKRIIGDISFRELIVHMLKWHDSQLLWDEVAKNKRLFVAEKVKWNGDKSDPKESIQIMDGYLDFPASTHNRICRLLYRKGLGRVFGLMEEDKTELIPVDSLADSVVHDVSYHEIYNPPKHADPNIKELAIGSVLVSGSTLKSSGITKNIHCLVHNSFYKYGKDLENYNFSIIKVRNDEELEKGLKKHKRQIALQDSYKLLIIFSIISSNQWMLAGLNQEGAFQSIELNQDDDPELISTLNNQSDDKSETIDERRKFLELLLLKFSLTINCYPSLFHWQPIISIEKGEPKQKRIGKTSEIAPKGWLSIEIPRYDANNEPIGARSPEESYEDWQSSSPIIVKLGHWCYEGHHDLITINIPDAVEDAFARKKPLANFLVCNILAFLGIKDSQLKNTFYKYTTSDPGILIYRSHSSSERILNNVLNCISSREDREDVMNRIFPILPLRKRFGGSTLLIPPRLQKEIKESPYKKNIMIFDDASISGRTLQDLRTTLVHLGASNIQITLIANRLRLPAEVGTLKYFWRMDVPTMGREGNCPLCHGLHQANSFATHLVKTSSSYDILQSWLNEWASVSPLNKWDTGLNSLPIQSEYKKYCYREEKGFLANIPINRSIGRAIHAAEIHAMTARDDYGLVKIKEQSNPAVQVEIAVSQLLLFGNELDQDLIHDFVVEGLLIPISKLPDKSPLASLAALTIMQALTTLTKPVQQSIANKAQDNISDLLGRNHGLILVAYFLSHDYLDRNNDLYFDALRLLSTRHSSVSEKLRFLYRETVSKKGNIHSEPIPRLIKSIRDIASIEQLNIIPETLLRKSLDSLASIEDIVAELGSELARQNTVPFSEVREELISSIKRLKNFLTNLLSSHERNQLSEIKNDLKKLQANLNSIADFYFYRIDKDESPTKGQSFKEEIRKIWDEKTFKQDVKTKQSSDEHKTTGGPDKGWLIEDSSDSIIGSDFADHKWVWIPWHKHIVTLVRDLLTNVAHSSESIPDPWDDIQNDKADMWVNIKFITDRINIYLANGCEKSSSDRFKEIEQGTSEKTRWTSLKDLGGTIELDSNKSTETLIVIKISIPYASYLASPHSLQK